MTNDDHIAQLKKGVAVWNDWRRKNPKIDYPDLRKANLSGADLIRANLNGADLIRANLNGADLSGADLNEA